MIHKKLEVKDLNDLNIDEKDTHKISKIIVKDSSVVDKMDMVKIGRQYHRLKSLSLKNLSIEIVPSLISKLIGLTTLHLEDNNLKKIPFSISKIEGLKKIYMQNNKLLTLPESIYNLKFVEVLNIGNNLIVGLSNRIIDMSHLRELVTDGNPMVYPPAFVREKGTSAILKYMSNVYDMLNLSECIRYPISNWNETHMQYEISKEAKAKYKLTLLVSTSVGALQGLRPYMEDRNRIINCINQYFFYEQKDDKYILKKYENMVISKKKNQRKSAPSSKPKKRISIDKPIEINITEDINIEDKKETDIKNENEKEYKLEETDIKNEIEIKIDDKKRN